MGGWLFLATALATASVAPWADGRSQGDDLDISIVTFGPGDEIAEWFGHAAIVVQDHRLGATRLYNYGEYEFDATLALKYLQGHLTFFVADRALDRTLAAYRLRNRDIRWATLALSSAQKLALARRLGDNVRPEHRRYLYDHYADNCTTRLRDAIDGVVGGQLRAQSRPAPLSLREYTRRMTAVNPFVGTAIDLLLNDDVDHPLTTWEASFLPAEFEAWLNTATIRDDDGTVHPLVLERHTIFEAQRPATAAPLSAGDHLAIGMVWALVVVSVGRGRRWRQGLVLTGVGLVIGLPGTVLCVMATLTDHHVTFGNENLLFANPLTLGLAAIGVLMMASGQRPWALHVERVARTWSGVVAALALGAVMVKVLPGFNQQNWSLLGLCVPPVVGAAFAVFSARHADRR